MLLLTDIIFECSVQCSYVLILFFKDISVKEVDTVENCTTVSKIIQSSHEIIIVKVTWTKHPINIYLCILARLCHAIAYRHNF